MNGRKPCFTNQQNLCQKIIFADLFVDGNVEIECNQYCPLECNSVIYEFTSSFSSYPTKSYARKALLNDSIITSKFINETITYDLLKQSVLSLNVYYDKLTYTEITKDAKTELIHF